MTQVLRPFAERIAVQTGKPATLACFPPGRSPPGSWCSALHAVQPGEEGVHVAQGLNLPFHATASGLCFLAFSEPLSKYRPSASG